MQTIWGKRCGNPFSWQEKKSATRNTTRLENRGLTNTHPIWGAIKSVKPNVSSRDCCRGLTGTAALEQLLQKHSWPSPKVLSASVSVGLSIDGGCYLSQTQQLCSPSAFCLGWWKPACFQFRGWYEPSPVYLLRSAFQCVIRSSLATT